MSMKATLLALTMCCGAFLCAETLNLEECIAIARAQNPSVRQQELSTGIAESKQKQSYSSVLPSLSITSGLSASDQDNWSLGKSVGLQAGMTFYAPGLYTGIKAARLNSEMSRAGASATENEIVSQISALYYRILTTQRLIAVYEGNIAVAEKNLKKTRAMYETKLITESDVLKAETQKGEFESQLLSQKQALKSYVRAMNILLGQDPGNSLDLEDVDVDVVSIPEYELAREAMLSDNPEYHAVLMQESVSRLNLQASKENYLPSISGSYHYSNYLDPALTPSNGISLNASWTLFNGLSRRQQVQQQKLRLDQSGIEVDNTLRLLEQELQDFYTEFETYTSLIEINRRRLQSASRDLEIVNQQYQLGKVTMLEQMQAQLALLSAESSLVEAQYARKRVEAEILKLINKI
ncbi:MAG: TolC family protein [Candidatus Neomarinimicrobiota bacterium]